MQRGHLGQQRPQRQGDAVGDQELDDAQGIAAQVVGIGRAAGGEPNGKEAHQAVEPVGQAEGQAGPCLGQRIAGEAGQVVLKDGGGHRLVFACQPGVVAAHEALQAGELDHQLGGQVGLAQVGGAVGDGQLGLAQAQCPADQRRQRFQALALVQHRAQLFLEGEGVEAGQEALQRPGRVLVVEELGVGKAGAQHVLVALAHHVQAAVVAVAHGDKVGQQIAACACRTGK